MPTEKVIVDLSVTGKKGVDETVTSLKEFKAQLKAAELAALNGDGKAAKRVAELKDKMDDLKDATKTLQGSGVEKLQNSFGLLTDGFQNFDGEKIGMAFKGIGNAMKAIPITLLITGISYLVEHFDELSKGSGVLAKILRGIGDALHWIGDVIGKVVDFFTDMAGATSDATRALEAQGKAIKETSDKVNAALQSQIKNFDNQIAVAKASGKSTVALEIAKQQAIIDTNLAVARQIEAFVRAGGEFDEEKKKLLTASLEAIKGAKVTEQIIDITDKKEKQKNYEDHLKKMRDIDSADRDMKKKFEDDFIAQMDKEQADRDKAAEDFRKWEQETKLKLDHEVIDEQLANIKKKEDADKLAADKEKALAVQVANAKKQTVDTSLKAAQGLSDLYFSGQLAKAKGNATAEIEIKKKQFAVNKALSISSAIMDGIRSVQAALTIPPPFGEILAVANGVLAAANVAKIASTTFDSSAGASIGSVSAGTPAVNTSAPTTAPPPVTGQQSTKLDANGNNLSLRAHVVENDITTSQQRIAKLKNQASF